MDLLQLVNEDIFDDPELCRAFLFISDLGLVTSVAAITLLKERRRRKNRSMWVRPYLRRRETHGHFENLMQELEMEDPVLYKNLTRLDAPMFHDIVEKVTPYPEKKLTFLRKWSCCHISHREVYRIYSFERRLG